jgi:TonB family protein
VSYFQYAGCYDGDGYTPGRILGAEEYLARLKRRDDIFVVEKGSGFAGMESACMIMALICGIYLSARQAAIPVRSDFPPEGPGAILIRSITAIPAPPVERPEPPHSRPPDRQSLHRPDLQQNRSLHRRGGSGTPTARRYGRLAAGLVFERVFNSFAGPGDPISAGGVADRIDNIFAGVKALRQGHGSALRRGEQAIGYGINAGESGFGEGGQESEEIDRLFDAPPWDRISLAPHHRAKIEISLPPPDIGGGALAGGRSRAGIMHVVNQNLGALRYAYNRWLRGKPALKGKITVTFAIDEFGKVVFCRVIESSPALNDDEIHRQVIAIIKSWRFERIDKPGDITEVVYPFMFSN